MPAARSTVADPAPAPGRPRSPEADRAIRDTTMELLATVGYANLTMSGVAAGAGVSTATVYRRWRSKLELVVDVLLARAEERPIPDTGSLAGDCRALLRSLVETTRTTPSGPIMSGLIGEIGRNRELAQAFRTSLIAPRRAALAAVLDRARARGELRPDVDYGVVIDLLFGPLYHRLLVSGEPITRAVADELAELVLRAVATDAPSARRSRRS